MAVQLPELIVADAAAWRLWLAEHHEESSGVLLVLANDVDTHCARARVHGAHILMEPTDFEYGERQYTAEDPAGHQWTFSETLDDVAPDTWGGTLVPAE